MNKTLLFRSVACIFFAGLAFGCSGGEELVELIPVTGTVTLNGEPLSGATITFIPLGKDTGRPCFGSTDESGIFTLKDPNGREGCPPGKCKVVISKFAKPDGSPLPADIAPEMASSEGIEHLPPNYSSSDQSQLSADVSESGGPYDFELKAKKKK